MKAIVTTTIEGQPVNLQGRLSKDGKRLFVKGTQMYCDILPTDSVKIIEPQKRQPSIACPFDLNNWFNKASKK